MVSKIKLIKPPISLNGKYFLTINQFFRHMVHHPQRDKDNHIPLLYWLPKLHTQTLEATLYCKIIYLFN